MRDVPDRADLDVALARIEAAGRGVQEGEVVRAREAGNGLDDLGEAEVTRELAPREVVEGLPQPHEKGVGVHAADGA